MYEKHPQYAHNTNYRGLSILELILVVAIVTILAAILIAVLRPGDILADARNRSREKDTNALLGIVYKNITDNGGSFSCVSGDIPTSTTNMSDNNPDVGDYDIAPCLVPDYAPELPHDPKASSSHYTDTSDYDLQYSISQSTTTGRVTITAQNAEKGKNIAITR